MNTQYTIRKVNYNETETALAFVWRVFSEFEAPDYTDEGVIEFYKSVFNNDYIKQLVLYGAYIDKTLIGTIATRNGGSHIALFFVDGKYQNQGIGTALFLTVLINLQNEHITVNSSKFAVEIYHKLGFIDTSSEQNQNGIIFTPMKCNCKNAIIQFLTNKNNVLACKHCDLLCKITSENNCNYSYIELFSSLLEHKNSLVRNRAILLLAVNIKNDNDIKTEQILNRLFLHITDEKPITARQCIKALQKIAIQCKSYRNIIFAALNASDFNCYNDSMRPLLEADKMSALTTINKLEQE